MKKSKSSRRWLKEHFDDMYVKRAKQAGYRSRAAYKLLELNEKDNFLHPNMSIVDLGAAPGGWLQVAQEKVGEKGLFIGVDLLEIAPIPGVTLIQGDFCSQAVYQQLESLLLGKKLDLILSDMAPNISGMKAVDQPKSIYLVELALDFAKIHLKPGGSFVAKVFQGEGFDALLSTCRKCFSNVYIRKPKASRDRSREVYLVAKKYTL